MWLLPFFKTIFKSLGQKPPTHDYPRVPIPKDPLVRGGVAVDISTCIFCNLCARRCPTDAIKVDKGRKELEISRFQCVVCAACVEVCPKKSIEMRPELDSPSDVKTWEKFSGALPEKEAPTQADANVTPDA